jgi:hypothetical protein
LANAQNLSAALGTLVLSANVLAPHAVAEPPEFPDLGGFTAVDASTYQVARRWGNTLYFNTSGGLHCLLAGYTGMSCSNITYEVPTIPATKSGCTFVRPASTPAPTGDPAYQFHHQAEPCLAGDPNTLLPTGSKISAVVDQTTLFTCAAIQDDAVACIDHDRHGFVLQPTHSWTF